MCLEHGIGQFFDDSSILPEPSVFEPARRIRRLIQDKCCGYRGKREHEADRHTSDSPRELRRCLRKISDIEFVTHFASTVCATREGSRRVPGACAHGFTRTTSPTIRV